jgi:hypothetical protein
MKTMMVDVTVERESDKPCRAASCRVPTRSRGADRPVVVLKLL